RAGSRAPGGPDAGRARSGLLRRRARRARARASGRVGDGAGADAAPPGQQGRARRAARRPARARERCDRRSREPPARQRRARGRRPILARMTQHVRRVVALLAGQTVAFGLSEGLLLISANAIFLDAYGSKWLPLTYVGIAIVGTLLAAAIARTLRRF